jgi:P-type Ca2+ transporter type 2C
LFAIEGSEADQWHLKPLSNVVSKLRTDVEVGLSSHEVRARHHTYGYNALPDVERKSAVKILLLQFRNLPIILLLVASALSYSLGRVLESIAIFSVVFMTIGFGFFMERSAEKAISSLVTLRAPKAKVLREGREREINAHDLVPGDIVEFEAGDKVPADCRLVESFDLIVDESPLTGESHGVRKDPDVVLGQVDLAERVNMCYMGTLVLEGRAKGLVVTTGRGTEMGKVGELLQGVSEGKTPLEHKIERLGRTLVIAVFAITGLYIAIGFLQGFEIGSIILSGIVLAIAAVPEGLPAVATITLAIGVKRMAKKNALVRRLASAETLGSVTVICTDKTGTLTRNEPTLQAIVLGSCGNVVTVTGSGLDPKGRFVVEGRDISDASQQSELLTFLSAGALCNNAEISHDGRNWTVQGDTTEGALVVAAQKAGLDKKVLEEKYERLWEDPFDSSTRRMITVHRMLGGQGAVAYIKGAPEAILSICSGAIEGSESAPLDAARMKSIHDHINGLTAKAYRILLIAYKELNGVQREDEYYAKATSSGFTLLGIAGIYDPPREEVKEAISFLRQAKTKVILITGDHPTTAKVLAEQLGISPDGNGAINAITGSEMEKMSVERLSEEIEKISVFARATPAHKLKIVEALQRKGHVVAMTGDGVNDAPALKQADIGVAMGKKGTDVAKESADLILLDDNFATITHALELGRLIFANIKKFVQYLFSCNISEVMTMLVAIIAALPFPLLPLQLLWMNLTINTFPALALAAEKGSQNKDYVRVRPPAKHEQMVSRKEWLDICVQASYMTAAAVAVFVWVLAGPESTANNTEVAQTMAFSTLSLVQTWHVLNYSSTLKALFSKSEHINRPLIGAVFLSVALLFLAIYFKPLADVLELHPLVLQEWGIVIAASAVSAVAISLTMRAFRYRQASKETRVL